MKKRLLFYLLLTASGVGSFAQNSTLKPQIDQPVYFDVSPPLRDMIHQNSLKTERSWKDGVVPNFFPPADYNAIEGQPPLTDPSLQIAFGALQTDTTIANFDGLVRWFRTP